mgnify:CR=1
MRTLQGRYTIAVLTYDNGTTSLFNRRVDI